MLEGLRAVRAVRHRTANALQAAYGWAQLGDEERTRLSLERLVREEALLSALSRSGREAEQFRLWQLLADAEQAGRRIAFWGEAANVRPGMLTALLPQLAQALAEGGPGGLRITCGDAGVMLFSSEE